MIICYRIWFLYAFITLSFVVELNAQMTTITKDEYSRAERLLSWNTRDLVVNDEVTPIWLEDGRFWYKNYTSDGYLFYLVDPLGKNRKLAFDHVILASQLSKAVEDTVFIAERLPFQSFHFIDNQTITFTLNSKKWTFNNQTKQLNTIGEVTTSFPAKVRSPNDQWEAYVQDYNLYIKDLNNGDIVQLTTDGEKFYGYGLTYPRPSAVISKIERRPNIHWSPNSKKIAVERVDERDVEHMHYISSIHQRPKHYSQPYALPGDSILPKPVVHIIDIEQKSNQKITFSPTPRNLSIGPTSRGNAVGKSWGVNSEYLYVDWFTQGDKSVYLAKIDAEVGSWQVLARDTSSTYVELGQREPKSWYVTKDGEDVFWWSERNGWAHIYRFGSDGTLKNQVTNGPWAVGSIKYIDEENQVIYFNARGREDGNTPYYAHIYRINFDGSDLTLLTPEFADHNVYFSPNGDFFVDTYSTIDTPPLSVLRSSSTGHIIMELERSDFSALKEAGWKPAEIFSVKARDGITNLYGLIYLPPDFDPNKKYPVIDHIYPGPQYSGVGNWEFKGGGQQWADEQLTYIGGEPFALAQLGFIVFELKHMGTPHRSKAFHDTWHGNFIDNGLPDHITALKQLAARYPAMDLERVGIYGHSGGGFATADALLRYPETFHVGVSGAGNHDNRTYNIGWAERHQGLFNINSISGKDNFYNAANKNYVKNLEGNLLLFHGDMDDNVHPAMTIQLVDELIKANKDFDLVIAPEREHGLHEPYFIRKHWDYFVKHLYSVTPPKEYKISIPDDI